MGPRLGTVSIAALTKGCLTESFAQLGTRITSLVTRRICRHQHDVVKSQYSTMSLEWSTMFSSTSVGNRDDVLQGVPRRNGHVVDGVPSTVSVRWHEESLETLGTVT